MVKNIIANQHFSQQGCHLNSNLKLQVILEEKQHLFQVADGKCQAPGTTNSRYSAPSLNVPG